jgi:hypothetical protein
MKGRFAPAPELFLPLSEGVASRLAVGESVDEFFERASNAELATVLLLQNLPALTQKNASLTKIELILADVIAVGLTPIAEGHPPFAKQVRDRFNATLFATGRANLQMAGIALLDGTAVAAKEYLTSSGHWNRDFAARHKARICPPMRELRLQGGSFIHLSDQQGRLFDDLRAGLDESLHMQGFAGVGKTFLIEKIFGLLNPATTLLMAYLPGQLAELKKRVHLPSNSDHLNAFTFGHMANMILNSDQSPQAWRITDRQRAMTNYQVTDQQIVTWLNISSVGPLKPREVASLCRRAVFSFCMSGSVGIEARHLPAVGARLAAIDVEILLEYTRRIWSETVSPSSPEIRFPVRNVHRIKYLALGSGDFPDCYKNLIVDEAHELSKPMLQILDRSHIAVITLGDDYQNIGGAPARRERFVRQRNITQSIRSGKQVGAILNPLIQLHPGNVKDEFEGAADYPTVISHYDESTPIPDKPTTIIVANEWGLLHWFSRLVDAGATFEVPPSARQELVLLLGGLCILHHEGRRANHRMLFQYESWDALATAMGKSHGFLTAQRLLDQGLTMEQVDQLLKNHCPDGGAPTKLARLDDVKNQEFDRVLLSRDLMRPPKEGSMHNTARVCSMLYTAASRAKHELLVPGNLGDWITDIAR